MPNLLAHFLTHSHSGLGALSVALGVSQQAIRPYLMGKRSKPSLEWFLRFIEALGGTVDVTLKNGEKVTIYHSPMQKFE